MDRKKQREDKRATIATPSCTAGFELNKLEAPPLRPLIACDPPAAVIPEVLIKPLPCPPPTPPVLNLPDGLLIVNDYHLALCPTAPGYGLTGTISFGVTAGVYTQQVLFQTLDAISGNQLNYLYESVPSSSASIISASLSGATSTVTALTKLTAAQTAELMGKVQQSKSVVNSIAVEVARGNLLCQAINDPVSVNCPTGSYTGPTGPVPANLAYVPTSSVTGGVFRVDFSLTGTTGDQSVFAALNVPGLTAATAYANALAAEAAQRALRCIYPNAEQVATCCTAGINCAEGTALNQGYTYSVPNDTLPVLPTLPLRIGEYTVPFATFFSAGGTALANNIASSVALDSLNCFYPSDDVAVSCTAPLTQYASPWPELFTDTGVAWSATGIRVEGDALGFLAADVPLNTRLVFPGPTAPPGCTVNDIYYVASAVDSGSKIHITFSDSLISHAAYEAGATTVNIGTTGAGVTATICQDLVPGKYAYSLRGRTTLNDVTSSIALATALATDVISSSTDCYWANSPTAAVCPTVGFTGINNIWYDLPASATLSSAYTSAVSQGSVVSYISQANADELAFDQARASLDCIYCNTAVATSCSGAANQTRGIVSDVICDFMADVVQNTAISISDMPLVKTPGEELECCFESAQVTSTPNCGTGAIATSADNFSLQAGSIRLCGASASTGAATALAQDLVNGLVRCFYYNEGVTASDCPIGQYLIYPGIVPANTIISTVSVADATVLAQNIANALIFCNPVPFAGGTCGGVDMASDGVPEPIKHGDQIQVDMIPGLTACSWVPQLTVIDGGFTINPVSITIPGSGSIKTAELVQITVCALDGTSKTILVPDFTGGGSNGEELEFTAGTSGGTGGSGGTTLTVYGP